MADITSAFITSMTEGVVSSLVEKLTKIVIEEVGLLRGVRGEIEYIVDELEMMKAFLRSAEDQQDSNEVARTWVKQVRELAYDAEDCIDKFNVHLIRPSGHSLSSALQKRFFLLSTLRARHQIATQIRNIKFKVEQTSKRKSRYHLTMTTPSSHAISNHTPRDPRMTTLLVEEKNLVGMVESTSKLISWLTDKNKLQLNVISVVGMGGLGKTTLVKKVCESKMLGQTFDRSIWITVSKFHIKDILGDMISQLQIPVDHQLRYGQLIEKLKEYLTNKRYLIVFDDIWTESTWNDIKPALPDSTNGSRVMVTTRIETVANTCCSEVGYVYKLQFLCPKRSLDLFCRRVFKNSEDGCPNELKELSNAILEKCKGLPLAIVAVAGVLGSKHKKTKEEWQQLNDRLGYVPEINPSLEEMKQILNLSYHDLPHSLRPCFLYLSKYPEDDKIKRRQVVELWVAEGLASGTKGMSAEEVAEDYFDEFINRSMIQPLKIRWDGKVTSCTVHDVMLEVMVSESREQNLLISSLADEHETASQQKIRRLSTNKKIGRTNLSHARSITMFAHDDTSFVHSRWKLLRVLHLQGRIWLSSQQLEWIGELIHLKYFHVSVFLPVDCLPKSWENLRQLETLDIGPETFRLALREDLSALRFPTQTMRVTKLQKLRHLRGNLILPPMSGIENLRSLQTLDFVNCREGQGQVIEELGKLTQLRCLSLTTITSECMSFLPASLTKLNSCLRSLKLSASWQVSFNCLESISSPPLQLQELKLGGELSKLLGWVASLKDVGKITLDHTLLDDDDAMQVLQNLPNLIHLKLKERSFFRRNLCFVQGGFRRLKILLLERFESVEFKARAMPNLARLVLSTEEAIVGIEHLVQLKEVKVFGPGSINEQLLEAVKTHPNQPRVTNKTFELIT